MNNQLKPIDGVVIGVFLGFDDRGPLVVFPGNPEEAALTAHSLTELTSAMIGCEVALLFEGNDPHKPLIVGKIVTPHKKTAAPEIVSDGKPVKIVAEERIELRCGKATIIMEKDGRITIRGSYVTSHATATNRIRGGSVNLN
ncbi:DUF6484 domain-containing protein [Mesorhizobium sp.]|uniref:DUF6484 domain-containing protein n=1 Tax=Mesorhizobium sp. TaxID=1871066 RepID=UPI000FE741A3|nr:DUF6484 domain-containing protein [Mesorhizobium sp.]RWO43349.1 MAG: hypothetical protein EOS13_30690 [Mesorhizobium sp.]TIN28094.1 MAG: hypothetical protein E5Y19_08800 [Mesorhizobium sp.]TIN33697.1 MAG: hypothetical protein E5Y13_31830 [Mesorhizobium sp.]TJU76988.1 MAG: hypothetical protein E5Y15_27595 [Mesorhizobium sp.]TJU84251.1 MAG: hypothetical protein E5Y10_30990 [Mesorhizobium sp.]